MEDRAYEKLRRCVGCVRERTDFRPKIALVLGSGLGGFADSLEAAASVDYADIEGFPVSTVAGHRGRFVFGYLCGVPVAVMQGRVHYYEGYPMADVVLPIRLLGELGAEILLLTNAAGGISERLKPGDFMVISDHITDFVPSPLIGKNLNALGPRFPDMSEVYKKDLREKLKAAGRAVGLELPEGVYIQLPGPNYETPAEIRMCKILGADAVGMSTACEAMAANHMGLRVCAISCISNLAAGISKHPLSHEEVKEITDKAAPQFRALISESIRRLAE